MITIVKLPEDEAQDYLTSKGFKLKIILQENGSVSQQYEANQHGGREMITYQYNHKTAEDRVLHSLQYNTSLTPYIKSFIPDTRRSNLRLDFQGSDSSKNIYLYSNASCTVSIYLNTDRALGLVNIKEKAAI